MKMQQYFILAIAGLIFFSCSGQKNSENVLPPSSFKAKMTESVTVLDVRTPGEFQSGHLEKAVNIDIKSNDFEKQTNQLDKAKPVLIYCLSGGRSERAAGVLRKNGYKVHELKGGVSAWQEEGLPLVK